MIGNKKILAVVTARAGSKGIPNKNYRDLLGKPLFMWSVEAGLQSKYVDMTILSSNCDKCISLLDKYRQEIGTGHNVGWLLRPDEISGDLSKNEEALIFTLESLSSSKEPLDYDIVVNLQPTSPCRLNGLLDRCIEEYHEGKYDSLLTATKDTPFIWQKINGEWRYTVDRHYYCDRKMRQEFEESDFIYRDNGKLYITKSKILLESECRIGDNPCVVETEGINSLQIDEEFDFQLIENMVRAKGLTSLI